MIALAVVGLFLLTVIAICGCITALVVVDMAADVADIRDTAREAARDAAQASRDQIAKVGKEIGRVLTESASRSQRRAGQ